MQEAVTRGRHHSAFPSPGGTWGGHWCRCSTWLAAGGLHLYLLEEGSSFALDNWLQQRASPLAGGGTLRQVLIGRLHGRKPETNQSSPPTGCFTSEPARPPHQPQRPRRCKDGTRGCAKHTENSCLLPLSSWSPQLPEQLIMMHAHQVTQNVTDRGRIFTLFQATKGS